MFKKKTLIPLKSSLNNSKDNSFNRNHISQTDIFKTSVINIKKKTKLAKTLTRKDYKLNEKINNEKKEKNLLNASFSLIDKNKTSKNSLKKNKSSLITLNEKTYINSLVNKFNSNQITTTLLFNEERKLPLNNLSKMSNKSLQLIISDEDNNKNNNKTFRENNSNKLVTKMVEIFNNRTLDILNYPKSSIRIYSSKNAQFRADLVNIHKDLDYTKEILFKLKKKYNEAVEIYEIKKDLQLKKALKDEQNFYRLKKEENINNNQKIHKIILQSNKKNKETASKSFILTARKTSFFNGPNYKKNKIKFHRLLKSNIIKKRDNIEKENYADYKKSFSYINLLKLKHNISNKGKFRNESESEERVCLARKKYEKFRQKKFEENAKRFTESIYDMINTNYNLRKNKSYINKESQKIKIICNNLKKLNKLQKFNTNISKIDIDEYKNDFIKLKEKMNKCEDEYFRVSSFNFKYNLSYLKPYLRTSTVKKYIRMRDSSFGLP